MRSVVEIGASVPAFLGKLWKLVNDTETNHLISWSPGGKTFIIKNQADFARELLPLYYKHNNMASFIRQLNMYGFHKITSVENGGLRYEKDEIEFCHPCFMRGHAYLLEHIKRKIANPKSIITSSESGEKILLKPELMNKVLTDVKQMKGKQESLDAKFSAMKQENEALWREVAILRQKHIKQQQIVNNLIQFLMSLVQPARPPNANTNNVGVKRPYQLMINSAAHNSALDSAYSARAKNIKLDKDQLMEEINEDNLGSIPKGYQWNPIYLAPLQKGNNYRKAIIKVQEDGPTIHELAHDDILHNDISQDSLSPTNFITVEVNPTPSPASGHSPRDPNSIQYHVTLEDGEEADGGNNRIVYPVCRSNGVLTTQVPLVTSPSPTIPTATSLNQQLIDQVINNRINSAPGSSNAEKGSGSKTTIPSSKKILSPSNFNAINPPADLRLPAEIFASDDSVSDAGISTPDDIAASQNSSVLDSIIAGTKDKMLGGINIKLEKIDESNKSKKSKKTNKNPVGNIKITNIKTELQDDSDWNMSLATVNNNDISRLNSVSRRDYAAKSLEELSSLYGTNANKADFDDHLDSMQTDLDSLRELLRSDNYSLDTNTLMGLFGSDDPFYGLAFNPVDERSKASNGAKKQRIEILNDTGDGNADLCDADDAEGNQLISYTGNIPDFEDISLPEIENENSQDECLPEGPEDFELNTPQVQVSPAFSVSH